MTLATGETPVKPPTQQLLFDLNRPELPNLPCSRCGQEAEVRRSRGGYYRRLFCHRCKRYVRLPRPATKSTGP
jgi:hypothetical protein